MSPSVSDLAEQIGRNLRPGDILVKDGYEGGESKYYEVLKTNVTWTPTGFVNSLLRNKEKGIKLRKITPLGPVENSFINSLTEDDWDDVILSEKRINRPSSKER